MADEGKRGSRTCARCGKEGLTNAPGTPVRERWVRSGGGGTRLYFCADVDGCQLRVHRNIEELRS